MSVMRTIFGIRGVRALPPLATAVLLPLAAAAFLPFAAAAQEEGERVRAARLDTLRVEVASRVPGGGAGAARASQILTGDLLRELPVRSVGEALQWAAGVDLQPRSPAQADVSIRGSSFEQVLVLVDGVRMNDPQTGHFALDLTVPLERVERVEILRGPASAIYGADAVAGVVNIVTRGARDARDGAGVGSSGEIRGAVEGGSWGSGRVALDLQGSAGGDGGAVGGVGGSWSRSDGHRPGTDHENVLLHGSGGVSLVGGRLSLTGGHARRDFGAGDFYGPFDSYEETRTSTGALAWEGGAGPVELTVRGTARRHDDEFILLRDDPAVYRNVHTSTQTGGEVVLRRAVGEALGLVAGGEAVRESVESNALGDRNRDRAGLFGEAVVGAGPWTASAGVRVDDYEGFAATWSPNVALSWTPEGAPLPPVRLRGAWGRSFRAPTWTERYYRDPSNVGNPDLDPERSWTAELGADVGLPGGGLARSTVFRRESSDLIDWARPSSWSGEEPPPYETRNVESARVDGLELAVEGVRLAGVRLSADASLLDVRTTGADGFTSKSALRPLTRQIGLGAARRLGGWLGLSARLRHARRSEQLPSDPGGGGGNPGDPGDPGDGGDGGDRGESWTLLEMRVAVDVPGGQAYLDLANATDTRYMDITGNPAPGRAIRLGYSLRP